MRPRPRSRRALGPAVILMLVAGLSVFAGIFAMRRLPSVGNQADAWFERYGHGEFGDRSAWEQLALIPARWWRSEPAPQLVLDIKFRNLQQLYRLRAAALEEHVMLQGDDAFVPGTIRHNGGAARVRLRFKGDFTSHIRGDKWSFRIHVKGDDHILGLRRFSIQHPAQRAYQGEVLFFETLRHVGVLAPRYFFVDAVINGSDVGLMAVEEHFSKELLESNGRRDGVIVRFDETLMWTERNALHRLDWNAGAFANFRNAPIDAFRSTRVAESPTLSGNFAVAVGLLRGFVEGRLAPSDVFDADSLGRFLAVSELWAAQHALYWNNQRFYLNPFTLKLEPIGFDADVPRDPPVESLVGRQEIHTVAMLNDPEIFTVYQETLQQLAQELDGGELHRNLEERQQRELAILRREFFLLEPYPLEHLKLRARTLAATSPEELLRPYVANETYPIVIHANLIEDAGRELLEIRNAVPHVVEIVSARWLPEGDDPPIDFKPEDGVELPLRLSPTPLGGLPQSLRIPFVAPESGSRSLEVLARISGQDTLHRAGATPYFPPLNAHPIPNPTVDEVLAQHSFLRLDRDGRTLSIIAGDWRVRGNLVVPRGFGLRVPAGTTLRFDANGALLARGELQFEGTPQAPIVLRARADGPAGESWEGIFVLNADRRSRWSHVTVRDAAGFAQRGLELTGGVTFYQSDVELLECRFIDNRAEDALNLVRSDFLLVGPSFRNTRSDALDVDFSDGTIEGGEFVNIGMAGGGDGIDISGSRVSVLGTRLFDVHDKALSVGERSEMSARGIVIERAGTAAASKDGSRLEISESTIDASRTAALMAYIKKPEYGPAEIEAREIVFTDGVRSARAQIGSRIVIDGRTIGVEEIDVAELYETTMKRGQ